MQRLSPPGVISRQIPVSQSASPEQSVSSAKSIIMPVLVDEVPEVVVVVVVVPVPVVLAPPPAPVPVLVAPPVPAPVPAYSHRPRALHT